MTHSNKAYEILYKDGLYTYIEILYEVLHGNTFRFYLTYAA